jgi:hypothetical protein
MASVKKRSEKVCCVLGCIRYQFLKAKRKIKEKLDARTERVTAKKKAKENKKAIVEAWTETIDQHSKATCYHNTITNETTWDTRAGSFLLVLVLVFITLLSTGSRLFV